MSELGKILVVVGLVLALAGALLWSGAAQGWFGRQPGDVHVTRGRFAFCFPIVTCLLLSVRATVLLWLFRR